VFNIINGQCGLMVLLQNLRAVHKVSRNY